MECRYCEPGKESNETLAELPIELAFGENFWGCRSCMMERGLWCVVHDQPHSLWNLGDHLCMGCHVQMYIQLKPRAREHYQFLLNSLPENNVRALRDWAEDPDNCVPLIPPVNAEQLVLWSLTAMALIRNLPFRTLLEHVAEKADLEPVIPRPFPITIP